MIRHTRTTPQGIDRRTFLRYSAGRLVLGAGLVPARWGRPAESAPRRGPRATEARTYVFNFSHMDTSNHDLVLVAGKRRVKLQRTTPATRRKARGKHPILHHVPDAHMTHHVQDLAMPADAVQLCYVQRVPRGRRDGQWDMALLFYHHPSTALREARRRHHARHERLALGGHPPVHVKWANYGISPTLMASFDDPVGEEALQDTTSRRWPWWPATRSWPREGLLARVGVDQRPPRRPAPARCGGALGRDHLPQDLRRRLGADDVRLDVRGAVRL